MKVKDVEGVDEKIKQKRGEKNEDYNINRGGRVAKIKERN